MGFMEYESSKGDIYRVDAGRELLKDFGITGSEEEMGIELRRWHDALSEQSQVWLIVCRLFAITPLFGQEDVEEMKPWKMERIAIKMGVNLREVEAGFAEAKAFWNRWRNASGPPPETREPAAAPVLDVSSMSDEQIEKLLSSQLFVDVDDKDQRRYIAQRILDLDAVLENDGQRSMARGLIELELTLFYVTAPAIRRLQAAIKKSHDGQGTQEQEKRMISLINNRNGVQEQIEKTMKSLGITEGQTGSMKTKRLFRDCLGTLVDAVADFEARGDRAKLDGVFTAGEIRVLTREFTSRPFQYRPDLVMTIPKCIEQLWNPEFAAPVIARREHRKLMHGFKVGLEMARSEDSEVVADLDPDSLEDRNDAVIEQAETEGRVATVSSGVEAAVNRAPAVSMEALPKPRRGEELADF